MKKKIFNITLLRFFAALLCLLFSFCSFESTYQELDSAAINIEVVDSNGMAAKSFDMQNVMEEHMTGTTRTIWNYRLLLAWKDSTINDSQLIRSEIYSNILPMVGDTILISSSYAKDSTSKDTRIYMQSGYTSDTDRVDTLSILLIGIPFNDSVNIIDKTTNDTPVNSNEISEKNAFKFSIHWKYGKILGKVYWVRVTKHSKSDFNGDRIFDNVM